MYEERAKKIADEMAAKQQEADRAMNDSMQRSQSPWSDAGHASPGSSARPGTPGMDGVVFSCWLGCSWVVFFLGGGGGDTHFFQLTCFELCPQH